jgi:hypothetical protein
MMQHNSQNLINNETSDLERFDIGGGSGFCTATTGQKTGEINLKLLTSEFAGTLVVEQQILKGLS